MPKPLRPLTGFFDTASQGADSRDVHERMRSAVSGGKVGAAVVGIYERGDVSIQGYGQTRIDRPQQPDGETLFEIGSITKVFTAIMVQRLVEHGKLDWDAPISRYPHGIAV